MGLHLSGFIWGSQCGPSFPQMGGKIREKPNPCWIWLFLSWVLINRKRFRVILSKIPRVFFAHKTRAFLDILLCPFRVFPHYTPAGGGNIN